jgi:uncharacterized oligopeptide transporter (OPT) family protein
MSPTRIRAADARAPEGSNGVPRAFALPAVFVYVLFAAASAAICAQINVRLGITPNTAIIGVLVAIAASRTILHAYRSPERQVMIETATSAGGFAGANIALVSFATLQLLGLGRLFAPLLAGILVGMTLDIWLGYRLFGSRAFPAEAAWPDGEAVGRVIQAGDEGGRLARHLLQGVGAGIAGRLVSLPMAGIGIAFIGNPVALAALAAGLLVRGYGPHLGFPLADSHLPHGVMIGAGLVQVCQTGWLFWRVRKRAGLKSCATADGPATAACDAPARSSAASDGSRATAIGAGDLGVHLLAFLAGAVATACLATLWTSVSTQQLALWIAFAALAALVHTIIVGYCAMLSGWFPSFAVAIALLLVAALLRFPLPALAMLAGYVLSTGPQFADLGYDLKSGWIIRGRGRDASREAAGRRQQFWLQELGAVVGVATAALAFGAYWKLGLVPPMSRVMATTISLTSDPSLLAELAGGAAVGIVLQMAGGGRRAVGVLLATGLLLDNLIYGYALAAALVVRAAWGTAPMAVRAPGLIAGDGIAGFIAALARAF